MILCFLSSTLIFSILFSIYMNTLTQVSLIKMLNLPTKYNIVETLRKKPKDTSVHIWHILYSKKAASYG